MNTYLVFTAVLLSVALYLPDKTTAVGCTIQGVNVSQCQLTSWGAWDCSGCKSFHSRMAVKLRYVCCKKGDTPSQCLLHCNVTGGLNKTELCNVHCDGTSTTSATVPTSLTTTVFTTQPTGNNSEQKKNTMMRISVCESISAGVFILGLIIGGTVLGFIALFLHRRDVKKRHTVAPITESKPSIKSA